MEDRDNGLDFDQELRDRLDESRFLLLDCEEHPLGRDVSLGFGYLAPNKDRADALAEALSPHSTAYTFEVDGEWGVGADTEKMPFVLAQRTFVKWVQEMFLAGQRQGCLLTNMGMGSRP